MTGPFRPNEESDLGPDKRSPQPTSKSLDRILPHGWLETHRYIGRCLYIITSREPFMFSFFFFSFRSVTLITRKDKRKEKWTH